MSPLYTLLALTPIAVVFILMVVMNRSATMSMGSAYVITALLALFVWNAQGAVVAASTINGCVLYSSCAVHDMHCVVICGRGRIS